MAVIKDYMSGNCRIIVHDDSIVEPEKVQEIIDNVSRIEIAAQIKREMDKRNSI